LSFQFRGLGFRFTQNSGGYRATVDRGCSDFLVCQQVFIFSKHPDPKQLTNKKKLRYEMKCALLVSSTNERTNQMCEKCESQVDEAIDERDLLLMALGVIGGLAESYYEEGYTDPMLYQAVTLAEAICKKTGEQAYTDKFTLLKIQMGERITEIIESEQE
jgi:hypothetical protein